MSAACWSGSDKHHLEAWRRQQQARNERSKWILIDELKVCSRTGDLQRGRQIHAEAVATDSASCVYLATALVKMYAKCRSMAEALQAFNRATHPDVVLWTALILGYADNGDGSTAVELFAKMRSQGCAPDSFTFVAALKACSSLVSESGKSECLKLGREIHSQIGCISDMFVQSSLISMYANCGSMTDARRVFDKVKHPNVVSWTALILGYAENGEGVTALDMFARMKYEGCTPDSLTFVAALKACTLLAQDQNQSRRAECLKLGKTIHSQMGCTSSYAQNALIDMYAKCRSMPGARQVFDSMKNATLVSWNALILGYADNGQGFTALDLFAKMTSHGCAPDSFTFVAALKACTSLANGTQRSECLKRGKEIHAQLGSYSDMYVQSSLISMYATCGSMADARQVFDSIHHPNVVSWTALISGYGVNGEAVTALDLFERMKSQGCTPTPMTFVAALKACGLLGALETGCIVHAEIGTGIEGNVILVNNLVDFYAKCGSLVEAREVFESHPGARDLVTWNALLAGYSRLGDSSTVFALLEGMQDAGFQPDGVTFLCILICCSHVGLVEKGKECLEAMAVKYGVTPAVEHYTCLIDLLGRSNQLGDAIALLQRMPCRPDVVTWMTLLGACHKWKNVETGRLAFTSLVELDGTNAAAYVLMAHIYGTRGMRKEQEMVLAMRDEQLRGRQQPGGQTYWTSNAGDVHTFSMQC